MSGHNDLWVGGSVSPSILFNKIVCDFFERPHKVKKTNRKKFLGEIYEVKKLKKQWKNKYKNLTKNYTDRKKIKLKKNIDEAGVYNHVPHNPLTIADEMAKLGLSVEGIYFYHYHAFPPVFETLDKNYFRKISWKIENPLD